MEGTTKGLRLVRAIGVLMVVGLLAGLIPAHSPASAQRSSSVHALTRGTRVTGSLTSQRSPNWSGYVLTHPGYTFSAIRGKWQQPALNCSDGRYTEAVFWVGLDGWGNSHVEQVGTGGYCQYGYAHYFAWWEIVPAYPHIMTISNMAVRPGDNFTGNVSHSGSTWNLNITNSTTGAYWSSGNFGCSYCASGVSAEWVTEAPCTSSDCSTTTRLANYGTAYFWATGAASSGYTGNAGSWNSYPFWMSGNGDWRSEPMQLYNYNTAFTTRFLNEV